MKRLSLILSASALCGLALCTAVRANSLDAALAQCVKQVEFCQELSFDQKKCDDQVKQVSKCSENVGSGILCQLKLDKIRPTQYSVGAHAAACKAKKIKKWDGQSGIKNLRYRLLMSKRQVPAIIGPGRDKQEGTGYYITDHHHLSYAMYLAHKDAFTKTDELYICVLEDRSNDAEDSFWDFMTRNHLAWLNDAKGRAIKVGDLPHDLKGLENYPYRTWSRWVRDSCGYLKAGKDCVPASYPATAAYFMEFKWADYLQANWSGTDKIEGMSDKEIRKKLKDAIAIAQGRQAFLEGLPGYSDGTVVPVEPVTIKDGCED